MKKNSVKNIKFLYTGANSNHISYINDIHINVNFHYLSNETGICSYNRFGVIIKNISENQKNLGKNGCFFKLELILTTFLSI